MTEALAQTLSELRSGDPLAAARLMELVYEPLRILAGRYFRSQQGDHTLQPTALVHEVFLRIAGKAELQWQDRAHFFAICAASMRQILADHARRRHAIKRGGGFQRITLSLAASASPAPEVDLLNLDEALRKLAALNERQARIVECRFFAGMTVPEVAHALGISARTVDNDWAMARAWMSARMSERG